MESNDAEEDRFRHRTKRFSRRRSGSSGPAAAGLKRPKPPLSLAARMRGLASRWAAE